MFKCNYELLLRIDTITTSIVDNGLNTVKDVKSLDFFSFGYIHRWKQKDCIRKILERYSKSKRERPKRPKRQPKNLEKILMNDYETAKSPTKININL